MTPAIVLATLRAEGGPALALDLAAEWLRAGHRPVALALSGADMATAPRFAALGVPVEVLDIAGIGPRRWPAIARAVAAALRRHGADALLSIPNGVHGAIFAGAAQAGVRRRAVHVGNYPWHWQRGFWKYRAAMRLSAPLTPDLVCVTEHVRAGVARHFGRAARRLHVQPNGIDLARFAAVPRSVPVPGRLRALMVGRLDRGKDHDTLLAATALLAARGVDVTLTLAGDGTERPRLEAAAGAAGLADRVRFLGARADVPALLAAADVFAFSVRPEEGFGLALAEAMAAGVPVVATDVGACREVLADGACGLLVPPGDAPALADALLRAPAASLADAARRRAVASYGRAAMATGYARILRLA